MCTWFTAYAVWLPLSTIILDKRYLQSIENPKARKFRLLHIKAFQCCNYGVFINRANDIFNICIYIHIKHVLVYYSNMFTVHFLTYNDIISFIFQGEPLIHHSKIRKDGLVSMVWFRWHVNMRQEIHQAGYYRYILQQKKVLCQMIEGIKLSEKTSNFHMRNDQSKNYNFYTCQVQCHALATKSLNRRQRSPVGSKRNWFGPFFLDRGVYRLCQFSFHETYHSCQGADQADAYFPSPAIAFSLVSVSSVTLLSLIASSGPVSCLIDARWRTSAHKDLFLSLKVEITEVADLRRNYWNFFVSAEVSVISILLSSPVSRRHESVHVLGIQTNSRLTFETQGLEWDVKLLGCNDSLF